MLKSFNYLYIVITGILIIEERERERDDFSGKYFAFFSWLSLQSICPKQARGWEANFGARLNRSRLIERAIKCCWTAHRYFNKVTSLDRESIELTVNVSYPFSILIVCLVSRLRYLQSNINATIDVERTTVNL